MEVEKEYLAYPVGKQVSNKDKELFYELLHKYRNIFTSNLRNTKDNTYKNLKRLVDMITLYS